MVGSILFTVDFFCIVCKMPSSWRQSFILLPMLFSDEKGHRPSLVVLSMLCVLCIRCYMYYISSRHFPLRVYSAFCSHKIPTRNDLLMVHFIATVKDIFILFYCSTVKCETWYKYFRFNANLVLFKRWIMALVRWKFIILVHKYMFSTTEEIRKLSLLVVLFQHLNRHTLQQK